MNIILTLDYELFFGDETGSVSKAMVGATEKLLEVLNAYNIKAVFFVDVGFLKQLNHYRSMHSNLEEDYKSICRQLKQLSQEGHDLQLHVHPHWEDSTYENGKWQIYANRYKLSDWPEEKVIDIVTEYKELLEQFTDNTPVFAYRAGGFCIHPFNKIKSALKKNGIWLDSSVFEGGYNKSETHFFDFRDIPTHSYWNFEETPLEEDKNGSFLELPISSYKASPFFYWKLALTRIWGKKKHESLGKGNSLPASKKWLLKKLLFTSYLCASIDGYKSSYLKSAFNKQEGQHGSNGTFVILGHPKALSLYSLNELKSFIKQNIEDHQFETFSELVNKNKIIHP